MCQWGREKCAPTRRLTGIADSLSGFREALGRRFRLTRQATQLVDVTDDLDEAMRHLERHAIENFGLIRHPRPSRWLGESVLDPTVAAGSA